MMKAMAGAKRPASPLSDWITWKSSAVMETITIKSHFFVFKSPLFEQELLTHSNLTSFNGFHSGLCFHFQGRLWHASILTLVRYLHSLSHNHNVPAFSRRNICKYISNLDHWLNFGMCSWHDKRHTHKLNQYQRNSRYSTYSYCTHKHTYTDTHTHTHTSVCVIFNQFCKQYPIYRSYWFTAKYLSEFRQFLN